MYDGDTVQPQATRLQKATRAFWANIKFYTARAIPLETRFQKFDLEILPVATYGSGSWVLCKGTAKNIDRWQNSMLRKMLAAPRIGNETYAAWQVRTTRRARALYGKRHLGVHYKWFQNLVYDAATLRHKAASQESLPANFLPAALEWNHLVWWNTMRMLEPDSRMAGRIGRVKRARCGGRRKQWDQVFVDILGEKWISKMADERWLAQNKPLLYIRMYSWLDMQAPSSVPRGGMRPACNQATPRVCVDVPIDWSGISSDEKVRMNKGIPTVIRGDSSVVTGWHSFRMACRSPQYRDEVRSNGTGLLRAIDTNVLAVSANIEDFVKHIYRELNKDADRIANLAMLENCAWRAASARRPLALRGHFDGAWKESQGYGSYGFQVEAAFRFEEGEPYFEVVSEGGHALHDCKNALEAEFQGYSQVFKALCQYAVFSDVFFDCYGNVRRPTVEDRRTNLRCNG